MPASILQERKHMLNAARSTVMRLEAELAEAQAQETREINAVSQAKIPMTKGYWDHRHSIEERLDSARRLVRALEEA